MCVCCFANESNREQSAKIKNQQPSFWFWIIGIQKRKLWSNKNLNEAIWSSFNDTLFFLLSSHALCALVYSSLFCLVGDACAHCRTNGLWSTHSFWLFRFSCFLHLIRASYRSNRFHSIFRCRWFCFYLLLFLHLLLGTSSILIWGIIPLAGFAPKLFFLVADATNGRKKATKRFMCPHMANSRCSERRQKKSFDFESNMVTDRRHQYH